MKKNLLANLSVLFVSMLFVGAANAQTDNNSNKDEKKTEKQEKNRPLKIIKKDPISRNAVEKCFKKTNYGSYFVRVRVTFHSSGEITNVEIARTSGCDYFDDDALKVAKKIKFEPAVKNGEPITSTKLVEYQAKIY